MNMRTKLNFVGLVSVLFAMSLPALGAAGSELNSVPSDAWGVIVIKNLTKLSGRIDGYAVRFGENKPELQKRLVRKLGVGSMVDMSKPMVIVVMNKSLYGDQPVGLILSVKDYESFAASFKGQSTEIPGLMKGKNEAIGECWFARKNSEVILGPSQSIVNAILTSKQSIVASMDADSNKVYADNDLYVRVNLQALAQVAKPFLMMFGAMGGMMANQNANGPQPGGVDKKQQQMMQAMGSMTNALLGFLDELVNLDIGIKAGAERISGTGLFGFKKGMETASFLASQKPTDKPLLTGLPGGSFSAACGIAIEPRMTNFIKAILHAQSMMMQDQTQAQKYLDLTKKSMELQKGQSIKVSMNDFTAGRGLLHFQMVEKTSDSKKYIETTRTLYKMMNEMQGKAPGPKMTYEYAADVETVDGVPVDEITIDLGKLLNNPALKGQDAQQAKMVIEMMLGSDVVKVKVAAADGKLVVMELGGDVSSLKALMKSARLGTAPIDTNPKVVSIAKLLPKTRLGEFYVDSGNIISGVLQGMMGMMPKAGGADSKPSSIPVIETPLMAGTVGVAGSSLRFDVVYPLAIADKLMGLKSMFEAMMPGGESGASGVQQEKGGVTN